MSDPSVYRRLAALEATASLREDRLFTDTGTWTPAFLGTTIAGTFVYVTQQGTWARVGNIVCLFFNIQMSAISVAPTGSMEISGVPFAFVAVPSVTFGRISNLDYPAGALEIHGLITSSNIRLFYAIDNATTTPYPAASFTNTATQIIGSLVYLTS